MMIRLTTTYVLRVVACLWLIVNCGDEHLLLVGTDNLGPPGQVKEDDVDDGGSSAGAQ